MHIRNKHLFNALLIFFPISIVMWYIGIKGAPLFIVSILSLLPIARVIGKATEELALQTNPTISGILSATFGNIIEIIIAIIAIRAGLIELVKASLVGSILANILLLIGLSIFIGGIKYKEQRFNTQVAGVSSTMLIIAVTGMSLPSIYAITTGKRLLILGDIVAVLLAIIYIAGLVFALKTHKHLFDYTDSYKREAHKPLWSRRKAGFIMAAFIGLAAIQSELLVESIAGASISLGISQTFIGFTFIAILTNIAEKSAAIQMALKNKIDISLEIGTNSAIQIALFVLPILAFISLFMQNQFSLFFNLFEIVSMLFAVMIINYLSSDGRCNWLEGAQLMTVYLIFVVAFFFAGR
ncbi:calcium/proton exchanger [Candidatus Woesearchaeota archaeon]|nr:calcium/proton exchanger [Candidatus Woesearchaeota archaeon]